MTNEKILSELAGPIWPRPPFGTDTIVYRATVDGVDWYEDLRDYDQQTRYWAQAGAYGGGAHYWQSRPSFLSGDTT